MFFFRSFRRDLLTWLTSRGFCVRFVSKRHGAKWRHHSVNGGKKETHVRKKIQQCVKYVVRYKAVNIENESKENTNIKQIDHNKLSSAQNKRSPAHTPDQQDLILQETKYITEKSNKPSSDEIISPVVDSKQADNNASNNFSEYQISGKKRKFFKGFPYMQRNKSADCEDCRKNRSLKKKQCCSKSFFKSTKRHQDQYENNNCEMRRNGEDGKEYSQLLVKPINSDQIEIHERDSKHSFNRRYNKPRHSTTTIETRIATNHSHKAHSTEQDQSSSD